MTVYTTPIPSGLDLTETEPLTLPLREPAVKKALSGRVPEAENPTGLLVTAVALPSCYTRERCQHDPMGRK